MYVALLVLVYIIFAIKADATLHSKGSLQGLILQNFYVRKS